LPEKVKKPVELELVIGRLAGEDNQEAFTAFYEEYSRPVLGYIRSFIVRRDGYISHDEVDAIALETWLRVWQKIADYDPDKGQFLHWVFGFCKYIILDYLRQNGRKNDIRLLIAENPELEKDFISQIPDSKPGPDEAIICAEDTVCLHERYLTCLNVLMQEGGYPHQIIAFAFNQLIFAGDSYQGRHNGYAGRVVRELSDIPLVHLCARLEAEYLRHFATEDVQDIRRCFEPLRLRMDCRVKDVISDNPSRARLGREILEMKLGDTILKQYYGKDPEHNISDWSNKIKQKVLRCMLKHVKQT